MLAIAGCSSTETTSTIADDPTTSITPTTTVTTAATTTTTTVLPTTTTKPVVTAPSDEDVQRYILIASTTIVEESRYHIDAIGVDAWGPMLRDGAILACNAFADDEPLERVIQLALAGAGAPFGEYGIDEFTLMLTVVGSGAGYYCPDIAIDFQNDAAAKDLTDAWVVLSGAPSEDDLASDASSFGNGTWIVGEDIEPGTYRTAGRDGCYWERLSGFSGESSDRITNGFPDADPAIVTIAVSDAGFLSEDCARWELVSDG